MTKRGKSLRETCHIWSKGKGVMWGLLFSLGEGKNATAPWAAALEPPYRH